MEGNQDEDMYLFEANYGQTPASFPGQTFDELFTGDTPKTSVGSPAAAFMNPNDLVTRQSPVASTARKPAIKQEPALSRPGPTPVGAVSSARSPPIHGHGREGSNTLIQTTQPSSSNWAGGTRTLPLSNRDDVFGNAEMSGMDEFEASNQQMATDFDFETAASTPSGYANNQFPLTRQTSYPMPFRTSVSFSSLAQLRHESPRLPAGPGQFYLEQSRETSPMANMLPPTGQSPWGKSSPSSGLEEGFNGISMNGDSPGNATFSPNLPYATPGLSFDTADPGATPPTFKKAQSSRPSTAPAADGRPVLTVFPTSLKSRVETQIPIRMTLTPFPPGVTQLRLPSYTISKPKFLAKEASDRAPEIYELTTSLVCTSAMQDPAKLDRAFARARGEDVLPLSKPSPDSSAGSQSSKEDEEKPLDGGEVRICSGCIQRERKRASRKKQKKPDEEELFQKDEEKRVIVFNTNEVKDWTEPTHDSNGPRSSQVSSRGKTMQVELPMRIACYCRHQNEKLGFQVIFTVADHMGKVIAQAMTNSIMITDDHKTHNLPPPMPTCNPTMSGGARLPGSGVFASGGMEMGGGQPIGAKLFKQSFSTTDLQGLQSNFNPNYPMASSNTFTMPPHSGTSTSTTLTPRNLSRPASPTGVKGPSKRRKQSGSGKIPSGLTMTRLETSHPPGGSSTAPNTATATTFAPSLMHPSTDRFPLGPRQTGHNTTPPTPNSNDNGFMTAFNKSFSMDNLPRQAMMSAPSSRQPSRPGSAGSNKNSSLQDINAHQGNNQRFGAQSRRPLPTIHKVVPAEGSSAGGNEIALLGNGFYQGLEIMFGDTQATTTTFWGDKCLSCIIPPSLSYGIVPVVFKHEHPQYSTQQASQHQPNTFTYNDDHEMEIYRMALKNIGKTLPQPTEDPYAAAQRFISGPSHPFWNGPQGYSGGYMPQ